MTIASEITRISNNIAAAYTAAGGKDATLPQIQNSDNLATCIRSISGGSTKKYQLFDRVFDDSNNEIGTVSGFFTDANDVEYAVVCLDAQYRAKDTAVISSETYTIGSYLTGYEQKYVLYSTNTATYNTNKILEYCMADSNTSPACAHCRSKSFIIDGITYYGQLPNFPELWDIYRHKNTLNSMDSSLDDYPLFEIPIASVFSSNLELDTQSSFFFINIDGIMAGSTGGSYYLNFVIPILEIPNTV